MAADKASHETIKLMLTDKKRDKRRERKQSIDKYLSLSIHGAIKAFRD